MVGWLEGLWGGWLEGSWGGWWWGGWLEGSWGGWVCGSVGGGGVHDGVGELESSWVGEYMHPPHPGVLGVMGGWV